VFALLCIVLFASNRCVYGASQQTCVCKDPLTTMWCVRYGGGCAPPPPPPRPPPPPPPPPPPTQCVDSTGNKYNPGTLVITNDGCTTCTCNSDLTMTCIDVPCFRPPSKQCPNVTQIEVGCEIAPDSCTKDRDCGLSYDNKQQQLCCFDGCSKRCTNPLDSRPLVPGNNPCVQIFHRVYSLNPNLGQIVSDIIKGQLQLEHIQASKEFDGAGCNQFQYPQRLQTMLGASAIDDSPTDFSPQLGENFTSALVVIPIVVLSVSFIVLVLVNVKLHRILSNKM